MAQTNHTYSESSIPTKPIGSQTLSQASVKEGTIRPLDQRSAGQPEQRMTTSSPRSEAAQQNESSTGSRQNGSSAEAVSSNDPRTLKDHMATVYIIEPESLFRKMLADAIEKLGHFKVVGSAADFSAIDDLLERRPEILVTEMFIGGKALSMLVDQIRPLAGKTKVLILSRASDQAITRQVQQLPAHGFVSKQEDPEALFQALEQLRLNQDASPEAAGPRPGFEANYNDPIACLSPREREIFQLLADGFQNTVIAKKLFISPRTVETHRARVVRKLGLTSNGDLIRFAIKHGLSTL